MTLSISAGQKEKIRAGDILGALTALGGIAGSEMGKIDVMGFVAYVAVVRAVVTRAEKILSESKIKGRS